jgi:PIN domain nuclease of toxin-antitoxin system
VSPDSCILDASAALAFVQKEPGYDIVRDALLRGAAISAVNLAEVYSMLNLQNVASDQLVARMKAFGLEVEPFGEADAIAVGTLRLATKDLGLSLADRACLALGLRLNRRVLATDRTLASAQVGVDVVLLR